MLGRMKIKGLDGKDEGFAFTARAQFSFEQAEKGKTLLGEVLRVQEMTMAELSIGYVAKLIRYGANDGAGVELETAFSLIDANGGMLAAMNIVGEAYKQAWPELVQDDGDVAGADQEGEASAGNDKKAK